MNEKTSNQSQSQDENPDPITGTPGSHPVGTGVGAAAAGAAGLAVGSLAGPAGAVVGAVVGALAGGLTGKATAEAIDPTAEDAYWRDNYANRSYAKDADYATYQPAYRYGWEARGRYPDREFTEVESELESNWASTREQKDLEWEKAKLAAQDAWEHIHSSPRKAK